MMVIPPGRFLMGSSEADTARDLAAVPHGGGFAALRGVSDWQSAKKFMEYEHPQHEVTISKSFALGQYLVTKEEFALFVRDTGYSTGSCVIYSNGSRPSVLMTSGWLHPGFTQSDRDPVVCVSWQDTQAYISWLNHKSQHAVRGTGPYQLPSEAEWEYATRAATSTARWWGNQIEPGHGQITEYDGDPERGTAPVGSFPPNPFGLYDVLGNAAQVVEDCWHDTYSGAPSDASPWLAGNCSLRSVRGGAWHGAPWASRSATRSGQDPNIGANTNGFRVAKTLP
jgi:formylglycine-generating enzyme required for sulfatase activity